MSSIVSQLTAHGNLAACLYAALGVSLMARAYVDRRASHGIEVREHLFHGAIYLCMAFAK